MKVGEVVQIHFLDHCEDGDKALRFVVWGRIDRVYKKSIRLVSWGHERAKDASGSMPDTEKTFTIVRSAITKFVRLVPEDLPRASY